MKAFDMKTPKLLALSVSLAVSLTTFSAITATFQHVGISDATEVSEACQAKPAAVHLAAQATDGLTGAKL